MSPRREQARIDLRGLSEPQLHALEMLSLTAPIHQHTLTLRLNVAPMALNALVDRQLARRAYLRERSPDLSKPSMTFWLRTIRGHRALLLGNHEAGIRNG